MVGDELGLSIDGQGFRLKLISSWEKLGFWLGWEGLHATGRSWDVRWLVIGCGWSCVGVLQVR